MQLMIDTGTETVASLRLAAQFLLEHARLREVMEPEVPFAPAAATPGVAAAPTAAVVAPSAPPASPPPSNVLPFSPPAPPPPPTSFAPNAATPVMSPVTSVVPPNTSTAAIVSHGASAAPPATEYDRSGVPFDARIHQKSRNQKKDGTWKIQKGLDENIVTAVMSELAPFIRRTPEAPTSTAPAPGASAPVALPQAPPAPLAPPAPPAPPGSAPIAPPPPQAAQQAPEAQGADPFRSLINKIAAARKEGRLTAEEVTAAHASVGVPALQLLKAMPHKIEEVESLIDSILVSR